MADARVDAPSLIVRGGPLDGHEEKLKEGLTVIVGSGRLANLRLDHPDIELAHVKVRWDEMGLSMVDNGSRKGTWLNGVPVETAGLLDGDVIEFTAPEEKRGAPCVLLKVPAGSVSEAPLPPQAPPPAPAPAPAPAGSLPKPRGQAVRPRGPAARRGRARPGLRLPDLRIVGLAAAALLLVVAAGWGAKLLFFTAPQIASIEPPQAEPGTTIAISGSRFRSDPTQNAVWFGSQRVHIEGLEGTALRVRVPAIPPGPLPVRVESGRGRSGAVEFLVLAAFRAASLAPVGGLPGDEITLNGEGFAEGVAVNVDGVAARVLGVEPRSVRFAIPALAARERGGSIPVVATVAGRSTQPLPLVFGRVPLVLSFDPAQATAGELIRIRGAGFGHDPQSNLVSFDGVPALVVAASSTELAVVLPPLIRPSPEFRAPLIVRALGRTSEPGPSFSVLRVEGRWVPRFVAGAADETSTQATVGTEIAPVLLLSSKDASKSVAARALRLAAVLNEAVDRALLGQAVVFEARKLPSTGLALVGAPDLLARVTPEDAVAYGKPPGLTAHEVPPPEAVASHWAALLNDYVVIGTSSGKPSSAAAVSPEAGAALARLRSALPWQYASGIPSAQVASLPEPLRQKLREIAFTVR